MTNWKSPMGDGLLKADDTATNDYDLKWSGRWPVLVLIVAVMIELEQLLLRLAALHEEMLRKRNISADGILHLWRQ
jgi:hypothetical protein